MWTCKECLEELTEIQAPPAIDEDGIYFVCPFCNHRNILQVVKYPNDPDDGPLTLGQFDA
ncbi:DNA-directed RNA polymerase subunit RPC12/RpoP [Silvimonas terrae]|uniref:DNA-directed RNA polymerase subunit RPC12/RpoP n=1 Tax=Silvimonas terrae TaxID=300266 RepID=A0A840RCS8_9NEIS|nr:DNA-directed RNA polymerase subunit RPC12/RpoP [Silvimonas terrae]